MDSCVWIPSSNISRFMDCLASNQETLENILDFIDEGLIEIETICLIPSLLDNESMDSERQG